MKHKLFYTKVRVGERGQITIPKKIRVEDKITFRDVMRITHLPEGSIIIKKIQKEKPEDKIINIVSQSRKINFNKAWKEVQTERDVER